MFDQKTDSEEMTKTSSIEILDLPTPPAFQQETELIVGEPVPLKRRSHGLIVLLIPTRKKDRDLPVWLHEVLGWGIFFGIISIFLGLQIYLNGILIGPANRLAIGLSVMLEIGLIWFWDLYWY